MHTILNVNDVYTTLFMAAYAQLFHSTPTGDYGDYREFFLLFAKQNACLNCF